MAKVEAPQLSPSEEKLKETQDSLSEYDFIRFTTADMNGVLRGTLLPADLASKVLKSGIGCYAALLAFGPTVVVCPREVKDSCYGNAQAIPDLDTLHPVPWADKYRVGQFMTEMYWNPTTPQEACPRNIARRMLHKLDNMGLSFYSGNELEFTLMNKEAKPVYSGKHFKSMLVHAQYESWFYDVASNMKKARVDVGTMHVEPNPSQFEFTTQPKFGIEAADCAVILKQGIKEMAIQRGWHANFMAIPILGELGNWNHLNFSVWNKDSGENILADETAEDKLSKVAKHWIAGIIEHAKALTALCCTTTNCYRALHTQAIPHQANWGIEDRAAMLRVKNDSQDGTYIENRLPTAPCNPYLVMAATIAAGLDGIVRKLPCPDPHDMSEAAAVLPYSLKEALVCLQEDAVMVKELGPTFVEWFVQTKTEVDLKIVEGIADDGKIFELEREQCALML